jgi:diacylglycerol kinase (CTP)
MNFKKRSDIHYARKIWHMSGVFVIFLAYSYLPSLYSMIGAMVAWLAFVPLDFARQKNMVLNDWVIHAFRPIMRRNELRKLAGTTYLLSGVLLTILLFPRPIVSISLLFLAFADPIASYVGIKWGRDKIFGAKSIQGFIAAYFVSAILCFIYLLTQNILMDHIIVVSLLAGMAGALAELVPIADLDDNLTLPLLSGAGLLVIFYFFGFFINVG